MDNEKESRFTIKDVLKKTTDQRLDEAPKYEKIIYYIFILVVVLVILGVFLFAN